MDFVERGKERPGRYGGTGGEAAADYSSSPGAKPMQQNTILCNAIQYVYMSACPFYAHRGMVGLQQV